MHFNQLYLFFKGLFLRVGGGGPRQAIQDLASKKFDIKIKQSDGQRNSKFKNMLTL